ncbi:hypothetical protein JXA85_04050 [Candidatus Woesearchaeota archaeon]|nr:hypothetical protein [Candidatus Woesearchaeota archaeon]
MKNKRSKKSQMFMIELALAILIFVSAMSLYYKYLSDMKTSSAEELNELIDNARDISESFLTPGQPNDWNSTDVNMIGIANNNRINETKLLSFRNISYDETKFLLATQYEFYVFFKNRYGNPVRILNDTAEGIGKPGINSTNIKEQDDVKSIIKVERIVVMNSDIARMVIYVWSI